MSDKVEFHFKSPDDSPGYLLAQVSILWQRKQKKVLDPLDLTHTQFVLLASLAWLSRESDSVTQIEIANQSNFDRMMVSKVLRTLEKKEFITRQEHQRDTRAKTIKLTEKGVQVLQKAIVKIENADLDFFSSKDVNLESFNLQMMNLINKNRKA